MVMMGKTSIISDWGTFKQKVAKSSTYVEAKSFPPTRAATKFHRLRAYFKIREWKGGSQLKPVEWGWKLSDGKLQPIKTDLPAGPVNLLAIIRCNCTSGCTTARCSCRKHGLHCSGLCGDCKGLHCTNSPQPDLDDDEVTFTLTSSWQEMFFGPFMNLFCGGYARALPQHSTNWPFLYCKLYLFCTYFLWNVRN